MATDIEKRLKALEEGEQLTATALAKLRADVEDAVDKHRKLSAFLQKGGIIPPL